MIAKAKGRLRRVLDLARSLLALVGAITIVLVARNVVWPLIDSEGVVNRGEFRGIAIGATRSEVALIVTGVSPSHDSKLKLSGYIDEDGRYCALLVADCDESEIMESEAWYLAYPGMLNERLEVSFGDGRVVSIRYTRSPFDP